MTNQEAFDTVFKHLLAQNKTSLNKYRTCVYRGEDGLQCAVGCLIPDEQYRPGLEGVNAEDLMVPALDGLNKDLLSDLQNIHDNRDTNQWRADLTYLASQYALTVPQ